MTKQVRRPPPDPYRKARFREIAREIVAMDRYNRKYGLSGAPWESLQYYPLRDFWCDGKQMISA